MSYFATPNLNVVPCSLCGRDTPYEDAVLDEGDLWACQPCVDDWERANGVHWEDGTPIVK